MIGFIFAAAVVLAQAAAPAAKSSNGVAGVTVTGEKAKRNAPDPKEVVCHREPVLGSMFPKEVCARREEIVQRTREDQKQTRDSILYNPLIIEGK